MNNYNAEKAARVWQRVHSTPEISVPEAEAAQLAVLINTEWTDAAVFLHLSKHLSGRSAKLLHTLHEQKHAHTACLKGIYVLLTGNQAAVQTPALPQEPVQVTLRRCYGRQMQCLGQYEHLASHPQYGPVFARLARQEQEHCRMLLEVLGSL